MRSLAAGGAVHLLTHSQAKGGSNASGLAYSGGCFHYL